MIKTKWTIATAVALAVSFGTNQQLMAQSDDEADGALLEEVIVTATKREESIFDVPIAITAFTQDSIERAGITNLNDIGKFVPNLNAVAEVEDELCLGCRVSLPPQKYADVIMNQTIQTCANCQRILFSRKRAMTAREAE